MKKIKIENLLDLEDLTDENWQYYNDDEGLVKQVISQFTRSDKMSPDLFEKEMVYLKLALEDEINRLILDRVQHTPLPFEAVNLEMVNINRLMELRRFLIEERPILYKFKKNRPMTGAGKFVREHVYECERPIKTCKEIEEEQNQLVGYELSEKYWKLYNRDEKLVRKTLKAVKKNCSDIQGEELLVYEMRELMFLLQLEVDFFGHKYHLEMRNWDLNQLFEYREHLINSKKSLKNKRVLNLTTNNAKKLRDTYYNCPRKLKP